MICGFICLFWEETYQSLVSHLFSCFHDIEMLLSYHVKMFLSKCKLTHESIAAIRYIYVFCFAYKKLTIL